MLSIGPRLPKEHELSATGLDFYHRPVKTARRKLTMNTICGFGILLCLTSPLMAMFIRAGHLFTDLTFVALAFFCLSIAIVVSIMFVRYRSEIRTIERLLNAESAFRP